MSAVWEGAGGWFSGAVVFGGGSLWVYREGGGKALVVAVCVRSQL